MKTNFFPSTFQNFTQDLSDLFSIEYLEKLSQKIGFLQRNSGKIKAFEILNLLFHSYGKEHLSLNTLCSFYQEKTGKSITKQSLNQRFNSYFTNFISQVLSEVLSLNYPNLKTSFVENDLVQSIFIKDSTSFQLPNKLTEDFQGVGGNSTSSGIKIQLEYDFLSSQVNDLSFQNGKDSDKKDSLKTLTKIQKKDLIIRDLGYFQIKFLSAIASKDAYYLFPLKAQVNVYDRATKEKLSFLSLEKKMSQQDITSFEMQVLLGAKEKYPCRLILQKRTKKQKDLAIKKLKKKSKNYQPKKSSLERANFFMYITNLPPKEFSINVIKDLYRLRWQIELIFKNWKSIGKINQDVNVKAERLKAILLSKFLYFFLNLKILKIFEKDLLREKQKKFSLWKVFCILQVNDTFIWINQSTEEIKKWLNKLQKLFYKYALLEKRKKHKSSLEISNNLFIYK